MTTHSIMCYGVDMRTSIEASPILPLSNPGLCVLHMCHWCWIVSAGQAAVWRDSVWMVITIWGVMKGPAQLGTLGLAVTAACATLSADCIWLGPVYTPGQADPPCSTLLESCSIVTSNIDTQRYYNLRTWTSFKIHWCQNWKTLLNMQSIYPESRFLFWSINEYIQGLRYFNFVVEAGVNSEVSIYV